MERQVEMEQQVDVKPKKKLSWWWLFVPVAILVAMFVVQLCGPSPALRVSKQTTYIDSHLREDGYPNYIDYVHDRMQFDVAAEDNSAVLYWKALWPGELSGNTVHQQLLCNALGMPMPNVNEAMVSPYGAPKGDLSLWIEENVLPPLPTEEPDATSETLNVDGDAAGASELDEDQYADYADENDPQIQRAERADLIADESISQSMRKPWTREQLPPLAKWVDQNKQPLDWLVEGSARKKYYNPSPNMLDGSDDSMIGLLLPGVQMLRRGARGLTCRAMYHLGEGNVDDAWRDLQACHRMARHVAQQGFTLVEQLVGIAIDAMASQGTQALLHHGNLTVEQADRIHRDLLLMPPMPNMGAALKDGERMMYLDCVTRLASGRWDLNDFAQLAASGRRDNNPILGLASNARVDWNLVMQRGNEWYDRLGQAAELSRTERVEELAKIEADLEALSPARNPAMIAGSLINTKARSEMMSDILLGLLLPAANACSEASDRSAAVHELNCLCAALAVFRAKNGAYPERLEELVPDVVDELPVDIYSGKSFLFRRLDDGFLLYSVFSNGKDDNGRDFSGKSDGGKWIHPVGGYDNENSDLVVLMPLEGLEYRDEE